MPGRIPVVHLSQRQRSERIAHSSSVAEVTKRSTSTTRPWPDGSRFEQAQAATSLAFHNVEGITSFSYLGGRDRDEVRSNVDLGNRPRISTDGGADSIDVSGGVDGLIVNSGSGADSVSVTGAQDGSTDHVVRVIAGSGNDFVQGGGGLGEASRFDGGAGARRLHRIGDSTTSGTSNASTRRTDPALAPIGGSVD